MLDILARSMGAIWGHRRRPATNELGKKHRHIMTQHPVGLERNFEVVAAGLEHPHLSKKACVTASAQFVP